MAFLATLFKRKQRKQQNQVTISAPVTSGLQIEHDIETTVPQHAQRAAEGPGFQFMSDLHLEKFSEYARYQIKPTAPYLILAGDIGRLADKEEFSGFLKRMCDQYKRVLLVPGNHEYWRSFRSTAVKIAATMAEELGNKFEWMDRRRVDFDDEAIIVLGCTLYSRILPGSPDANNMDFQLIGDWTVTDHNAEHERDRQWLKVQLADIHATKPQYRVIVATHFPPSIDMTVDPRRLDKNRKVDSGDTLLSDFRDWLGQEQVSHFIYGHTHWNTIFTCGSTTVTSNQRSDSGVVPKRDRTFDLEATL